MSALDPASLGLKAHGNNVLIYSLTRITSPGQISLGSHVIVDDFVFLQGGLGLTVGDFVHVASFASITGGGRCMIGDFSTVSSGARIFTGTDIPDGSGLVNSTIPDEYRSVARLETRLASFSFVGANSVVHPGVTVGEGAVVGSHSLVLEDVEEWTINVGIPSRPIKSRPRSRMLDYARRLLQNAGDETATGAVRLGNSSDG
jgi:acetyltransferase-like isoleucine patch superfamily enzyme